MRHCCVVPFVVFHWHKYAFFRACAPHLSFLVMVFPLIMEWIVCPRMSCGRVLGSCMLVMGICGVMKHNLRACASE